MSVIQRPIILSVSRGGVSQDSSPFSRFRERPDAIEVADVAELADALDSGSSARKGVEVQVLSSALLFSGFLAIAGSPVFLWDTHGDTRTAKNVYI